MATDPRGVLLALAMLDEPYDADPTLSHALAQFLGYSSDAPVVQVATLDVVDRHALTTPTHFLGALNYNRALPTAPLRHMHGYRVELFGTVVSADSSEGRVWHLDFGNPLGADRPIGVRAIRLWRVRAFYGGSKMYAESRWPPGHPEHLSIHGFELMAGEQDGRHARRGLRKLRQIPTAWRPPGHPRLQDRLDEWLPYVQQAAKLEAAHPDWTVAQLAIEARLPGRTGRAKEVKLRRWRDRARLLGYLAPA